MSKKSKKKILLFAVFTVVLTAFLLLNVSAAGISIDLEGLDTPQNTADTVKIIVLLTVIALVPSILVLVTGFTRIVIILSFVRNALGLQQTPPNQVIIGLALFLTVFLMSPILVKINDEALQPYIEETITQDEAIEKAVTPLKSFMLSQMDDGEEELLLFMDIAGEEPVESYDDLKLSIVIPAFILSELKRAFIIGFFIYIPFLIIDLVVSSTLMSLGMMMLPPAMVAMPFKLILFLIVDGWSLIVQVTIASFV